MTDIQMRRLSLKLAVGGALLVVIAIYGNLWMHRVEYDLPWYEVSKPALADWPTHRPPPPSA